MSTEKKNPRKRDQALNDATSGQFGEEPRPDPKPSPSDYSKPEDRQDRDRREAARKKSKYI